MLNEIFTLSPDKNPDPHYAAPRFDQKNSTRLQLFTTSSLNCLISSTYPPAARASPMIFTRYKTRIRNHSCSSRPRDTAPRFDQNNTTPRLVLSPTNCHIVDYISSKSIIVSKSICFEEKLISSKFKYTTMQIFSKKCRTPSTPLPSLMPLSPLTRSNNFEVANDLTTPLWLFKQRIDLSLKSSFWIPNLIIIFPSPVKRRKYSQIITRKKPPSSWCRFPPLNGIKLK